MADIKDADAVALIQKKIEYHGRLTQTLIVVCCLTVVGTMFYSLTALITAIPDLVIAKIAGNLQAFHNEWFIIDNMQKTAAQKAATVKK